MPPSLPSQSHKPSVWAERAFTRLSQDGLDPLPDNFALFYAYYAGTRQDLNLALDTLTDGGRLLTQEQCTDLFQTYISLEAEERVLTATSSAAEIELQNVLRLLSHESQEAARYGETLTAFSTTISQPNPLDIMREAVAHALRATQTMAEQNEHLRTQLTSSTRQLAEVRTNLDKVRHDSLLDPLTTIGNRKFFDTELTRITREARKTGEPLSLLMADIDHFKRFNDTYGHLVGDQILRLVARTLIENLKGRDIIARYGGDEFVVLLPCTALKDAVTVANALRVSLEGKQIRRTQTNEILGVVTTSIGATVYLPDEHLDAFVERADSALYAAKQAGRCRVVAQDVASPPS